MDDKNSDCADCSSINVSQIDDDVDSFTDDGVSYAGHWNIDPEETNEESVPNIGVDSQDINEPDAGAYADKTIFMEFTKSSKSFKASDFRGFIKKYVGEENVEKLENWKHPNLWIMDVKNKEIRENLLRMWKTKIKRTTCWITPYHKYEIRGFLYWLPNFVSNDEVKNELSQFGEVLLVENVVQGYLKLETDLRYFGLRLKDGMVQNDLPHFLKFNDYRTLLIVRGRQPACFHCREFGHHKKDCKKYKEKLTEYCKNPEAKKPRTKPRGRRHIPTSAMKYSQDEKHRCETNSTPSNLFDEINGSEYENASSNELSVDEHRAEISTIMLSLKEWKTEMTGVLEKTLENIENNLKTNATKMTNLEAKEDSVDFLSEKIVKSATNNVKQITADMIEQTMNNLKSTVTKHFGLNSTQTLKKQIGNFEPSVSKISVLAAEKISTEKTALKKL